VPQISQFRTFTQTSASAHRSDQNGGYALSGRFAVGGCGSAAIL
jgi:hypothetical protein